MTLDRRLPGVYVDIEDRSLAMPTTEIGRSGYVVLLSDRGPHNRVVELNSRNDLYDLFGRPNFARYGHAHYLADKYLERSGKLYVCRPAMMEPVGEATLEDCMAISNAYIKMNVPPSGITEIAHDFNFINNSNIVLFDTTSYTSDLKRGDWIYPIDENSLKVRQIIDIDVNSGEITLDARYDGETVTGYINKFTKFSLETFPSMRYEDIADPQATDVIWYFYATGAGEPYNRYSIRGVRNIQFERIYTDDDGEPLYPYSFIDIAVYRQNEDNTHSLVEGPWTASLINQTGAGSIIRDIFTGQEIYLPTVINKHSKLVRCVEGQGVYSLMSFGQDIEYPYEPDVQNRLLVQSMFASGTMIGLNNIGDGGIVLQNGSNGNLFDENDNLNFFNNGPYQSLVSNAYTGGLQSVDGSVELIVQEVYPWYLFDYVLCGGYGTMVANAARTLVDLRGDCLLLSDTGAYVHSPDDDMGLRRTILFWNTWNAMLYVQYREIEDPHTGRNFFITPVYHAIERHLHVDALYWIAEPVAGIEKGAISGVHRFAYKPKLSKLGDMVDMELNPVIQEPDGTYLIHQLTTWKRLSIMKRAHVVKFVQYCKKRIPVILKDIVQRKATQYWINQCSERINGFMAPFLDKGDSDRYAAITHYNAVVNFDDVRSEINIALTIKPIRAIERIMVNIIVT